MVINRADGPLKTIADFFNPSLFVEGVLLLSNTIKAVATIKMMTRLIMIIFSIT